MGLDIAENAALSGMKAHKKAFDSLAVNIANANNEDYNLKKVNFKSSVMNGVGVGVELGNINRNVDQFLQVEWRNNTSDLAMKEVMDDYNSRIQILFGKPGTIGTLNEAIDSFFGTIKLATSTPEMRLQVAQKADALAKKIQDIASGLQKIRYDADRDMYDGFKNINLRLKDLQRVQESIAVISNSGGDNTSLLDQRDAIIGEIAKYIDVNIYTNDNNVAYVSTSGGLALYSNSIYEFRYNPAVNVDVFVNNLPLEEVTLTIEGSTMVNNKTSSVVMTGGKEGEITNKIKNGKITGLQQLRDIEIPKMLAQLDRLAANIRDKVNAIHNDGGGMPPANELTGTTLITDKDFHQFYGKMRMAVTDDNGRPVLRADGTALNPLVLDLTKLDAGGNNPGSPDIKTIIKEINQYFYYDQLLDKTSLANLEDIRIASRTNNMVANGVFDFDFEIVNNSTTQSIFEIQSIEVYDNTATLLPGAVTTTLPIAIQSLPGDRIRTPGISADFSTGAGGPYEIRATVKVIEPDGKVSASIIHFMIDDNPAEPNIMNDRYVASSVSSGDAIITSPSGIVNFAIAEVVDERGNVVGDGQPGYLRIKALNPSHGVAFNELDSIELGFTYSNGFSIPPTRRGFSHFFGLNNLFVDNYSVRSSAAKMEVNQKILDNSNLFSFGTLEKSASYVTQKLVGDTQAKASIEFTANPAPGSTITMNGKVFTFVPLAVGDNEITIGANLPDTLNNMVTKLNTINSYTISSVDKATYSTDGFNTLIITHNAAGTIGNKFTIGFNLLGGAIASIDNGPFNNINSGNLLGGIDKKVNVTVNPNSYEISSGSAQIALRLLDLAIQNIEFSEAGGLPVMNTTIGGYAGTVVSYAATRAKDLRDAYEKQKMLTTAFEEKLREGSGVNVDDELANTVVYQNSFVASATIFSTTRRLYDVLLDTMRA